MKFVKVMFLHLSLSHSVHGGVPGQVHPWADTPPGRCPPDQVLPQDQVCPLASTPLGPGTPLQVHLGPGTPPGKVHPLGRCSPAGILPLGPGTPPRTRYPPGPGTSCVQCMLGDMGNKWAVRILLECILF